MIEGREEANEEPLYDFYFFYSFLDFTRGFHREPAMQAWDFGEPDDTADGECNPTLWMRTPTEGI